MPSDFKLDNISVTWLGHASFRINDGIRTTYIDPFVLPDNPEKADVILLTHDHGDHCDPLKIESIRKASTKIIGAKSAISKVGFGNYLSADVNMDLGSKLVIHSVEAYNTNKFREPNKPFHPKGLGIGFVLTLGKFQVYHAGDTDKINEMSMLSNIDLALLPCGGTYTMTTSEAADAALVIRPKNLVPMHFNSEKYGIAGLSANPMDIAKALVGKGVMVRILDPLV